jgi:Ca-activated chloride channel family protein
MKPTTIGLVSALAMAVTASTVYAVTPDGGFGGPAPAGALATESRPAGSSSLTSPAEVDAPRLRSELSVGSVVRVDARVGHPTMPTSGGRTYVLLEVTADPPSATSASSGAERASVDLAIAIDRSGSMTGTRIENARRAAVGAVERLRDGDTVSVVAFDTAPQIVVPRSQISAASRPAIVGAIRAVTLGGDTCISCGIEASLTQLQGRTGSASDGKSTGVRRVLLLSDGKPTSGVSDAKSFRDIGARALSAGTSITTVGLDLGYNEEVMTAIAIASNGAHHFVESDADLPKVFEAETASLVASGVGGATAELDLAPGVELVQLFDRPFTRSGSRLVVPLGDLAKGDKRTVLLEVSVPGGAEGPRDLVNARVTYRDLVAGKDASESGVLGVALREGAATDVDAIVLDRLQRSETTAALQEANSLFSLGKGEQARQRLEGARRAVEGARQGAKLRAPKPRAEAVDRSLEEQMQQLDDARDGFAPPASPSPVDAPKQEKSKKQNAARSRDNML